MLIDRKIEEASEEIDQIISKWGFSSNYGMKEEKRTVVGRWFHNFQPSEFEDALLILKNIQYYNSDIMHISNPGTLVPLCYTKRSFC